MTRTYVTWQENSSLTSATAVFADRIFSDAIADFFFSPNRLTLKSFPITCSVSLSGLVGVCWPPR